jgi:NAD(P)-dependent dehydrogenase (short-subunit alcohol dehydrogenase family)
MQSHEHRQHSGRTLHEYHGEGSYDHRRQSRHWQALVDDALRRRAKRVYAATRRPWVHADGRVTRLAMDVTNATQIREPVEQVESLDILINNAGGYSLHGDDFSDRSLRTVPGRQPLRSA